MQPTTPLNFASNEVELQLLDKFLLLQKTGKSFLAHLIHHAHRT